MGHLGFGSDDLPAALKNPEPQAENDSFLQIQPKKSETFSLALETAAASMSKQYQRNYEQVLGRKTHDCLRLPIKPFGWPQSTFFQQKQVGADAYGYYLDNMPCASAPLAFPDFPILVHFSLHHFSAG